EGSKSGAVLFALTSGLHPWRSGLRLLSSGRKQFSQPFAVPLYGVGHVRLGCQLKAGELETRHHRAADQGMTVDLCQLRRKPAPSRDGGLKYRAGVVGRVGQMVGDQSAVRVQNMQVKAFTRVEVPNLIRVYAMPRGKGAFGQQVVNRGARAANVLSCRHVGGRAKHFPVIAAFRVRLQRQRPYDGAPDCLAGAGLALKTFALVAVHPDAPWSGPGFAFAAHSIVKAVPTG